jgi:hypothetical protein
MFLLEQNATVAGSVVLNRQVRLASEAYLKKHLGLPLTDSEAKGLPEPQAVGAAG